MKRDFTRSIFLAIIATMVVLSAQQVSLAAVASSTNYKLQSDSINFGGGLSTSTSYRQESTGGEVATGEATSTNYKLKAGYQQMQEVYISMTSPSDVTLSPSLAGITGGTSNGSTTVTVTTDSPAGYSLSINAQNNPAMQKGAVNIADYNQGIDNDFSFSVVTSLASFGFSPSGADLVTAFKDNGSLCGVGSSDTALACWAGLLTTPIVISQSSGANHPNGTPTIINFRVGIGSGAGVESGVYTATTTLTALPL
jgi:hypothetical protein